MYVWPTETEQPIDVQHLIVRIRQTYPTVKWTHLTVPHPDDDDGIWFFWLPDQPGEVQIESSSGACPFLVEIDKHAGSFTGASVQEVAERVVAWLALPGGHLDAGWHPR